MPTACNRRWVRYLATSSAGQTGDHHIYRLTEGNTAQGVLAADIAKPDISPLKVLQSMRHLARLCDITRDK